MIKAVAKAFAVAAIGATISVCFAPPAFATDLIGMAKIVDGDTLRIGRVEVDLFGISAPGLEMYCLSTGPEKVVPCGEMAMKALSKLIANGPVTCAVKGNRDGRPRAICSQEDNEINREMVRQGWARAIGEESRDYLRAEKTAIQNKAGLWAVSP